MTTTSKWSWVTVFEPCPDCGAPAGTDCEPTERELNHTWEAA